MAGVAVRADFADGYHDAFVHPSEPNYFWMVAGQNFGILDDGDPAAHHIPAQSHIADQLELAGLTWKAYQESMGAPCAAKMTGIRGLLSVELREGAMPPLCTPPGLEQGHR